METHRKHRQVGGSEQSEEGLETAVFDHQVSVVGSITLWGKTWTVILLPAQQSIRAKSNSSLYVGVEKNVASISEFGRHCMLIWDCSTLEWPNTDLWTSNTETLECYNRWHDCWVRWANSTCNVAQGPNGLLADVWVRWRHQVYEGWNGPSFHDCRGLVRGTWGDVGQRPGRLKLDGRAFGQCQKTDKPLDEAGVNDAVDGRVLFSGEQLPVQYRK